MIRPTKEYTGRSTIRMYNCDCMDLLNSGKEWDLAIVDPPYGIDRDAWDSRPDYKYWDALFDFTVEQIVFGGNYFNLPITESWLCWDKTNNGKSFFKHKAKFELIWLSIKTKPDFIRYTLDGNVEGFKKAKPNYNKKRAIHSCQKPVPVYKDLLIRYSKEGDTILDTHGGSMSIAIACWDLGFDLDICELDTDYFNGAVKRFEQHIKQTTLF